MKKIRLISEEEYLKEFSKEPEWTGVDYDNDVYIFLNSNNDIVGDCVLFIDENFYTTIDNFEIRFKNQGYGRKCVDLLKNKFGRLYGESVPEALGFWNRMGANFNNDDLDSEDDEYALIRFRINGKW